MSHCWKGERSQDTYERCLLVILVYCWKGIVYLKYVSNIVSRLQSWFMFVGNWATKVLTEGLSPESESDMGKRLDSLISKIIMSRYQQPPKKFDKICILVLSFV